MILKPEEGFISHQEKVFVKGKVEPQVQVFINDQEIFPNEDGEFLQEIFLSQGINELEILALNQNGKQKKITREITFEPL